MLTILLIVALAVVLLLLGFEMILVIGIPAILTKLSLFPDVPDFVLVQKLVGGINHSTLLAIPFFIYAAELMSSGQIAKRLVNLIAAVVGHRSGGIGHTVIGGSMTFGSVSGSAPATVAAMGRLMFPELRRAGYRDDYSLGLIVSSAETALLIPPSITLIIYGWMTGTSVTGLFAGGLVVGLLLGLAFAVFNVRVAAKSGVRGDAGKNPQQIWHAFKAALWALGLPVIILGGIYSGYFTPTEAAAVSVVYALTLEVFVYREFTFRDFIDTAESAAISTAVIFALLAVGSVLAYFITLAQVPDGIVATLDAMDASPLIFLLAVNVVFLIAGMFIDPNSALLILVPSLYPVALSMGIDPVHFGLIVCLNVCIGMITPPFGLDLFVASSTLQQPVVKIVSGVWPFVLINLIVLGIVTYVPGFSLFLPNLIR